MMDRRELLLHEEVALLALHDKKGTVIAGGAYLYVLCGAILAELLTRGRICVEDPKKRLVGISDSRRTGNGLLDECLSIIAAAKRRASLQTWLTRFAKIRHLRDRVALDLCGQGILRADEEKVLFVFSHKIYPEIDSRPGRDIIARMRKAVLSENREVDTRTTVLLSLARSAGLLKVVFDKWELKERKGRIAQLVRGDLVGEAARKTIESAHAALMVSAILPAIIASGGD